MRSYCGHSGVLARTKSVPANVISDLQHDLRALGYDNGEISGVWGASLDAAVRAVRFDLTRRDPTVGAAAYNTRGSVVFAPAGGVAAVEPALANCIAAMCDDGAFIKIPSSADPLTDNQRAWNEVMAIRDGVAPTPILAAIFQQESGGRHYHLPTQINQDSFVTVGFDRNDPATNDHITSRGYGIGQYTLFHHPPTEAELNTVVVDPPGNVQAAFAMLRDKFDHELISPDPKTRADDRHAEWPLSPLRICKYARADARYLADCQACAAAAGKVNISPGQPVYPGASLKWAPTAYYASATYHDVPDRTGFLCDWPYALRRYNGGGINSYHYQARVLINLVNLN